MSARCSCLEYYFGLFPVETLSCSNLRLCEAGDFLPDLNLFHVILMIWLAVRHQKVPTTVIILNLKPSNSNQDCWKSKSHNLNQHPVHLLITFHHTKTSPCPVIWAGSPRVVLWIMIMILIILHISSFICFSVRIVNIHRWKNWLSEPEVQERNN